MNDAEYERVAKAGFEQAIRNANYEPAGEHTWENQSQVCRDDWVKIAKAIEAAFVRE